MDNQILVTPKPYWQSKTLWFNAVVVALVGLESQLSVLQPLLPGNVYAWIAVGVAVGNKVLRVITDCPVSFQSVAAAAAPAVMQDAPAAPSDNTKQGG